MSETPTDDERQISTDRETIRTWADRYDAVPTRVTGGAGDHLRLVPEADATGDYEQTSWDEFFDELESRDRVVILHEDAAADPLEVTGREDLIGRSGMDEAEFEDRLMEGEVVTTEITETTVVESVVVEETTVESELIDSEIVDQRVVDADLVGRECTNCEFVEDEGVDRRSMFDDDRYFSSLGDPTSDRISEADSPINQSTETKSTETATDATGTDTGTEETGMSDTGRTGTGTAGTADTTGTDETVDPGTRDTGTTGAGFVDAGDDFPYHAELDVDETWAVTAELRERFTVESRIEGTEVTESDSIEDHDIDVEGLHRSIVEGGIVDFDHSPDHVMTEYDIESTFDDEDRILTHFDRERLVEDEVVDRKRLRADVTGTEFYEMETISTRDVPVDEREGVIGEGAGTTTTTAETTATGETGASPVNVTLTQDDVGKTVVDDRGDEVGKVTDVEQGGEMIYVDPHQSITERIQSALGWDDEDEYPLRAEHIDRVTDDRVELKGHDQLPDE